MKCDQGYLCPVCGEDVEELHESTLYLRYIIGEVPAADLLGTPDCHILCNKFLAQFIRVEGFPELIADGVFARTALPPDEVERWDTLVTRGWQRLLEVAETRPPIRDYPLPEFRKPERATV